MDAYWLYFKIMGGIIVYLTICNKIAFYRKGKQLDKELAKRKKYFK